MYTTYIYTNSVPKVILFDKITLCVHNRLIFNIYCHALGKKEGVCCDKGGLLQCNFVPPLLKF